MAHAKHEQVRERYHRCCGYCGVSETETGGELTVDHFDPVTAGGSEDDENLVYACFRCNTYKGEYAAQASDVARGFELLHPIRDDVALHIRDNPQSGHLEALTERGRFQISLFRLNRPQLVQHRKARRLAALLAEAHQLLMEENQTLEAQIANLEAILRQLKPGT